MEYLVVILLSVCTYSKAKCQEEESREGRGGPGRGRLWRSFVERNGRQWGGGNGRSGGGDWDTTNYQPCEEPSKTVSESFSFLITGGSTIALIKKDILWLLVKNPKSDILGNIPSLIKLYIKKVSTKRKKLNLFELKKNTYVCFSIDFNKYCNNRVWATSIFSLQFIFQFKLEIFEIIMKSLKIE